jgi:hypothetical protein
MDPEKLKEILAAHKLWRVTGGEKGTRANLARADLVGANLARADLAGANLADAYLVGADLAGANLAGANLAGANLVGANLADAYLVGADLARANLARANLARADLAGAEQVIDVGMPNGWRCVGWMDKGALSVRVGCHNKTIADAREYWAGKKDRREVMAALDYVEAVAKLRAETDKYWEAR